MVGRITLSAVLVAAATASQAMPISFRVVSAHVVGDGEFVRGLDGATPGQCKRFRLGDRAALRYFAKAREVTEHEWREALDWTPCSAHGTLKTGDGKTYGWTLDQSGRGSITVTKDVAVFLDGPEFAGVR